MAALLPIVGIPCDRRVLGGHPFHMAGEKYIAAMRNGAGALPLLIPSLVPPLEAPSLLERVDGLLFTGSPSNVSPSRYGGAEAPPTMLLDEARDATTLPLLAAALRDGIPVFAICRGFQELNVALGGTLHPFLQDVPGFDDHRADPALSPEDQYGPAHDVIVEPGGVLEALGISGRFTVNSLHGQGIGILAGGLRTEARAPDGAIEAVSADGAAFVLGVQWHPEWDYAANPVSRALFAAFRAAMVRRHGAPHDR